MRTAVPPTSLFRSADPSFGPTQHPSRQRMLQLCGRSRVRAWISFRKFYCKNRSSHSLRIALQPFKLVIEALKIHLKISFLVFMNEVLNKV